MKNKATGPDGINTVLKYDEDKLHERLPIIINVGSPRNSLVRSLSDSKI